MLGAAYRRRTYEVRDQDDRLFSGPVFVQEFNYVVQGELTSGNAGWSGARFVDHLSIGRGPVTTQYQQFMAISPAGLNATLAWVPLAVRDMNGNDYGTLGIKMEKDVLFINADDGKVAGVYRWCP